MFGVIKPIVLHKFGAYEIITDYYNFFWRCEVLNQLSPAFPTSDMALINLRESWYKNSLEFSFRQFRFIQLNMITNIIPVDFNSKKRFNDTYVR